MKNLTKSWTSSRTRPAVSVTTRTLPSFLIVCNMFAGTHNTQNIEQSTQSHYHHCRYYYCCLITTSNLWHIVNSMQDTSYSYLIIINDVRKSWWNHKDLAKSETQLLQKMRLYACNIPNCHHIIKSLNKMKNFRFTKITLLFSYFECIMKLW